MAHNHLFILQALILVGATTFVATVFHYAKLPTIVGFIVAGLLIGPYGLGLVSSVPGAELLSEVGVMFLMFTIGLELSYDTIKHFRRPFFGLGIAQVVGTVAITALTFYFTTDVRWQKAVFFGFLFALSSTAIVVKLLQDKRDTTAPYGVAAIGVLLCQDLFVIPMMLAVPFLARNQGRFKSAVALPMMGPWLLKLVAVVGILWVAARFVVPFVLERVAKTRSRELFFFSILLLCFGVAFTTDFIGLSFSFGAFIAGLMIAESAYGRQATSDIVPLRDNFLGLFFASVGMLVDPWFMLTKFHWIVLILLSILVIKSGIVYGMARILRYTSSTAVIAGLMVFQLGEFSFVLANLGKSLGLLNTQELQMFFSVSVASMMLTPLVMRLAPRIAFSSGFARVSEMGLGTSLPNPLSKPPDAGHTIIIGFGVAGQNLAIGLGSLKIPYVVIEQNYALVQKFGSQKDKIIFGDASRDEILEHAAIESARLVVISVSGIHMTEAIVAAVRRHRLDVHIVIRAQYSREAEAYRDISNADIVVAEFETTIELIARSLHAYGVEAEEIHKLMHDTRQNLRGEAGAWSDFLRQHIDIPSWGSVGSVRPFVIRPDFKCVGKSLSELSVRQLSGATILVAHRKGLGAKIPTGEFTLAPGDVIHVLADDDAFAKLKNLLL